MNGEKAYEKVLSMAVIRKPQSKTTTPFHTWWGGYQKRQTIANVVRVVEK